MPNRTAVLEALRPSSASRYTSLVLSSFTLSGRRTNNASSSLATVIVARIDRSGRAPAGSSSSNAMSIATLFWVTAGSMRVTVAGTGTFRIVATAGYGLVALVAIALPCTSRFFFNPQMEEQEAMNAAWGRFAEDVAELNALIENAPFDRDEQTAATGYRHIARFLATFLADFTDFRDPEYPQFSRFPNTVARIGWDNPYNPYLAFRLRGDHTYRLRGNTRNFDLVTINVYSGMLGHTPVSDIRTISSIASDDLGIDENDDFVLTLSAAPADGDWLKLEPDAQIVDIGRGLGIYGGHVNHEGHIPRTLLSIMESEGVVE